MRRLSIFTILILALALLAHPAVAGWGDTLKKAGDAGSKALGLPYTPSEALDGARQALHLGTDYAVEELGKEGGFAANPAAAIPLPDALKSVIGVSGLTDSFNKAAENAVPEVGEVFHKTIDTMDMGNPTSLVNGGDTAITDYFQETARPTLKEQAKPVVSKTLDAAGAGSFSGAIAAAQQISKATGTPFDPVDYVTDQTLDAMFKYMGDKEKDLRESGGAGATELLKKLF